MRPGIRSWPGATISRMPQESASRSSFSQCPECASGRRHRDRTECPGQVWACAMSALGDGLRRVFDAALMSGSFPPAWKEARLVLLRKPGKPPELPSAYRPDMPAGRGGQITGARSKLPALGDHLGAAAPDLSDRQYGFRRQRSTVDAILLVRSLSHRAVERGGCQRCGVS